MLSFVVPAHNEERFLGATLRSIHAAATTLATPYEIVVVNDASTDATPAIAREGGARVVDVDLRKISAVRNAGAKAAQGERFIFVDADTEVSVDVIRAAMAALDGGAAGGGAAVRFDGAPLWARVVIRVTVITFRILRLAAGCFIYATREAFEAVGGFDERYFAAEEIIFSRALKSQGRFMVLREAVTTSARKVRTQSPWKLLWMMLRLAMRGHSVVRQRRGMDFWYEDRR